MNNYFIDPQTKSTEFDLLLKEKLLILPKNSGLETYRLEFDKISSNTLIVRAEDVPFFVEKILSKGIPCIGLTGRDLFKEYKLNNPTSNIIEVKNLGWADTRTLFGKPVLCLLGPKGKKPDLFNSTCVIAINKKYSSIAKNYLGKLKQKGAKFVEYYLSGATELAYAAGIADAVIDIVVSGDSASKTGLRVYDRIIESEAVLVGGYDAKLQQ
ncbi:MAG: hypothetical protein WCI04_05175 [archaeon]